MKKKNKNTMDITHLNHNKMGSNTLFSDIDLVLKDVNYTFSFIKFKVTTPLHYKHNKRFQSVDPDFDWFNVQNEK